MTPTLRDELMKMAEAAGKATPGPWKNLPCPDWVNGSHMIRNDDKPWGCFGEIAGVSPHDAEHFVRCSPERIKALAEVAMAAEYYADCRNSVYRRVPCRDLDEAWVALQAAIERLGKAVGT